MVFHTANRQRLHLVFARDAAEVGPEPLLEVRPDQRSAFLGSPHAMHQATGEGMHGFWIRCALVAPGRPRIAHRFNGGPPYHKRDRAPQGRKKPLGNRRSFFRPWRDSLSSRPGYPAMN